MATIDDIFDWFEGPANVGKAIGVTTEHAAAMRRRGSIPVAYWPALLSGAAARRLDRLTNDELVAAHVAAAQDRRRAKLEVAEQRV